MNPASVDGSTGKSELRLRNDDGIPVASSYAGHKLIASRRSEVVLTRYQQLCKRVEVLKVLRELLNDVVRHLPQAIIRVTISSTTTSLGAHGNASREMRANTSPAQRSGARQPEPIITGWRDDREPRVSRTTV